MRIMLISNLSITSNVMIIGNGNRYIIYMLTRQICKCGLKHTSNDITLYTVLINMRKLGVTLKFYNIIFTFEHKPMSGNGGFEQKG